MVSHLLTCELLAERYLNGSCLDERCLANMLKVFDLRYTVVVDEVVVFLSSCESTADFIREILNVYILIVA